MKFNILLFVAIFVIFEQTYGQNIDPWEVRCLVCKATVNEMIEETAKIDPKKVAEVSGFRLDPEGNAVSKTVRYSKSEIYLTELMENICEKMDDYAKVTYKKTKKLGVIKFMTNGQMNPEVSEVDFVQDGDLNKSLKHYCLEILEDHEEAFLEAFMSNDKFDDVDIKICSEKAKYCHDAPADDEYNLEEEYKDEL